MYCPKCATPNNDEARFCNGCGANLSFMQQAGTEYSADAQPYKPSNHIQSAPTANLPNGRTKIAIGISLLLVSIMVHLLIGLLSIGLVWLVSLLLLLSAFGVLGKGVAEMVTAKRGGNLTPDTQSASISYARNSLPRGRSSINQIVAFGVAGAIVGGILGFLFRPAAPLIGQLDFGTVVSRGTNLTGLDQILVSTAQASFNYLIAGIILGCVIGVIASYSLSRRRG
jgi:zinc-ribbon domain